MAELFDGSHFALFCITKSTHFFRLFFACGRSSLEYRIEWSAIPFSNSGVLLQPPATHLVHFSCKFFTSNTATIVKWLAAKHVSFLGRRHNCRWTHSFQNSVVKQNGADLWQFLRFRQAIENWGFNQIQNFFHHISLNSKWIRFSEKKIWGLGAL